MLGRSDGVDEERAVKKILIVLTNTAAYGERNVATGLWLREAAEFMDEAIQRGYAVDFVSPKGGYVPLDPRSMKPAYVDRAAFALYRTRDFQERELLRIRCVPTTWILANTPPCITRAFMA